MQRTISPILGGWLRPSSAPIAGRCMKSPMTRPLPATGMRGTARCAEDPWTPGAMGRFHSRSSAECQMARIFELASDQSIRSALRSRAVKALIGALLIVLSFFIEGPAKRAYFSGVDPIVAGTTAGRPFDVGGASKDPHTPAVALLQVEYPKRMDIGDTHLVVAHVKVADLERPSHETSISVHSPAFEIAPKEPQALPQGTNSESGLQWAVLPKTMGNQVLLLDIPQILWNPPRKEGLTGWFKPTPIMKVNGVRISDFDQKRLELRIEVTTLFGISEIRFKIIQYSLAFFGFVLTYPLLIEY